MILLVYQVLFWIELNWINVKYKKLLEYHRLLWGVLTSSMSYDLYSNLSHIHIKIYMYECNILKTDIYCIIKYIFTTLWSFNLLQLHICIYVHSIQYIIQYIKWSYFHVFHVYDYRNRDNGKKLCYDISLSYYSHCCRLNVGSEPRLVSY